MAGSWISIRATGIDAIVRSLIALGVDVEDLRDAFADIAEKGAQIASRYAPVGSGRDPHPGQLRDDIRGNRARNKAVVTSGRARVPYAGAINYGWRAHNIEGVAYMQRIDEQLVPHVPRMLEDSIGELIKRRGLS